MAIVDKEKGIKDDSVSGINEWDSMVKPFAVLGNTGGGVGIR